MNERVEQEPVPHKSARRFRPRVFLVRLMLSIIIITALWFVSDNFVMKHWNNSESIIVKLLSMEEEEPFMSNDPGQTYPMLQRKIVARALTGDKKDSEMNVTVVRLAGSGVELITGRRYLLADDTFDDGTIQYSISDAYRLPHVLAFVLAIAALLLIASGWAGFRALLGLVLSIAVLVWGMLPAMISGMSPVPIAGAAILLVSTVTIICVVRRARYWTAALLGSLGGVACAFVIGQLMIVGWQITGLASEGAPLLSATLPELNMRGVFMSAVLVGAIGAVLDVGVSVTASMGELVDYAPDIPLKRLLLAGINVGSEVLGSMINTLILAYMGSSLPMALLLETAGVEPLGALNDPYIAQQIMQSLAGTAGLLCTIPMTALFFVIQEAWDRHGQPEFDPDDYDYNDLEPELPDNDVTASSVAAEADGHE